MKYFITGGAGFIGSNITDRLFQTESCQVIIFDDFSGGRSAFLKSHFGNPEFKLIEGDVLDSTSLEKAMKGCNFVIHLSANPDIARGSIETDLDIRQSVLGSYNVLEAMRNQGIKQLAFTSGSGVYGDVGSVETAENYGPLFPVSMYGASKLGAEAIISAFCHMFGMTSWFFRFANVVGGRQTHGVGYDFLRKLRKDPGKLVILGNGLQSKSYIHVSDAISAMLIAIRNTDDPVNVFNVATGDYISVNEIAQIVCDEMGLREVEFSYTGGERGWTGDVPVVRLNSERIRKLGWRPKYSSAEAVRHSMRELLQDLD